MAQKEIEISLPKIGVLKDLKFVAAPLKLIALFVEKGRVPADNVVPEFVAESPSKK